MGNLNGTAAIKARQTCRLGGTVRPRKLLEWEESLRTLHQNRKLETIQARNDRFAIYSLDSGTLPAATKSYLSFGFELCANRTVDSKSTIPASDPNPWITKPPQAHANHALFSKSQPSDKPFMRPVV